MNHKVLLADDSLTIQKVIKITLANQPYEIIDAGSEDELLKKLPEVKPKIVFLDFNLSDKHTGYELSSKIKEISPKTKVLLLLGTFDSVDDGSMVKCGASDKIIKPFDSNKFIAICRRLSEEDAEEVEIKFPAPIVEEPVAPRPDETSQWEMKNTKKEELKVEPKLFDVKAHLNQLDEEVNNWGMSIPGVISGSPSLEKTIDLPPVMDLKKVSEKKAEVKTSDSIKYPDTNVYK
jgi:DNA-binding response OmpR family regulator